jgi:hypothetical protein
MDQYTDDERVEDLKKVVEGERHQHHRRHRARPGRDFRLAVLEFPSAPPRRKPPREPTTLFVAAAEKSDAEQTRQRGQALLPDFPQIAPMRRWRRCGWPSWRRTAAIPPRRASGWNG